jgi:hypothetical protein
MVQKPPNPHKTEHLTLDFASPINYSPTFAIHPANYQQKVTHGGKTAQVTGRADQT